MTPLTQPQLADAIYEVYEEHRAEAKPRDYLGGSAIGRKCKRQLWYDFRKAKIAEFPGRLLRLFETGHREEDRMIEDLKAIGLEVYGVNPETGEQFEVEAFGGHFAGHLDGLVRGVPDAPKQWHLFEAKTSNSKGFRKLSYHKCDDCNRYVEPANAGGCPRCSCDEIEPPQGVKKAKPVHYAQMQVYMGLAPKFWDQWGLDGEPPKAALYMVHCKEDDRLYLERVHFDQAVFEELGHKAKEIIESEGPPDKIAFTEDYYLCRWCDFSDICHGQAVPRLDCRTCIHSTPAMEGQGWVCDREGRGTPLGGHYEGCPHHLYLPPLLENRFGSVVDYDQSGPQSEVDWIKYSKDGVSLINATMPWAEDDTRATTSRELEELAPEPEDDEEAA
jgi:hypothetical protein